MSFGNARPHDPRVRLVRDKYFSIRPKPLERWLWSKNVPASAERVFWLHWQEGQQRGDWCSEIPLRRVAQECDLDVSTVTRAYQCLVRLGCVRRTDPGRDPANPFQQATAVTEVRIPAELLQALHRYPNRRQPTESSQAGEAEQRAIHVSNSTQCSPSQAAEGGRALQQSDSGAGESAVARESVVPSVGSWESVISSASSGVSSDGVPNTGMAPQPLSHREAEGSAARESTDSEVMLLSARSQVPNEFERSAEPAGNSVGGDPLPASNPLSGDPTDTATPSAELPLLNPACTSAQRQASLPTALTGRDRARAIAEITSLLSATERDAYHSALRLHRPTMAFDSDSKVPAEKRAFLEATLATLAADASASHSPGSPGRWTALPSASPPHGSRTPPAHPAANAPKRQLSLFHIARLKRDIQSATSCAAAPELVRQVVWSIEAGALRRFSPLHALNIAVKKIREGSWTRPHRMPPNWARSLSAPNSLGVPSLSVASSHEACSAA